MKTGSLHLILIVVLLAGCSYRLHPDLSEVSADQHYPTAEFYASRQKFFGVGVVALTKGDPLSNLDFAVRGHLDGTVRVDSERCGVHKSITYKNNQDVGIHVEGVVRSSCIFDITVIPVFPGQKEQGIRTYELRGQLLMKALEPGEQWFGMATKVRVGEDDLMTVPFSGKGAGMFSGCGNKFKKVSVSRGTFYLTLSEFFNEPREGSCVIEGVVVDGSEVVKATWLVWSHGQKFTPLPHPYIEPVLGGFYIQGDPAVSIIVFDGNTCVGNRSTYFADKSEYHNLTMLTTKGRAVSCRYFPVERGWGCQN